MDAYRIGVKFFIDNPAALDCAKFVPMFHGWIQAQALAGHQLIDVADYHHVPKNPSVVLVAHEATISLEETDSPLGLFYARKRPLGGTFPQRLGTVMGAALNACQRMEHDTTAGQVKFQTNHVILRLLDRLHAPNDNNTLELVRPDVGAFRDAIATLNSRGLSDPIREHIGKDKPFLGICLGLQLLFEKGYEDGEHAGLGILKGECVRFDVDQTMGLKVPHMGWNQL